ncbi:MAG: hydrogenase expression/formation protein HypE [Tannerellaceae bacterium]|jgi:hydrogenase expression/formation protein HypE|nr:hydrogenase expression/formation protein HypE [Tannerellaceae bacterium]
MSLYCPIPFDDPDRVLMAHGGGGLMTARLIESIFYPAFGGSAEAAHDGYVFDVDGGRMACTTDSFVVKPLFFPGGDIGDLAVNGTVNDIACCGARPLVLTAGFILEEGLLLTDLRRIAASMGRAAAKAGVRIVAGDTKVVERGRCDGLYINTTGIGVVDKGVDIAPGRASAGDVVICSGEIGLHGIAIMSERDGLGFDSALESDTAALNTLVAALIGGTGDIHVLRDPTRGGVAATLNEIALASAVHIAIDEESLPIPQPVRTAAALLGLDPLYIANEGVMLVILPGRYAADALRIMHSLPEGRMARVIGQVEAGRPSVRLNTPYGGSRVIDMPLGEQLPRIC